MIKTLESSPAVFDDEDLPSPAETDGTVIIEETDETLAL